jgi:hypothetical protein
MLQMVGRSPKTPYLKSKEIVIGNNFNLLDIKQILTLNNIIGRFRKTIC